MDEDWGGDSIDPARVEGTKKVDEARGEPIEQPTVYNRYQWPAVAHSAYLQVNPCTRISLAPLIPSSISIVASLWRIPCDSISTRTLSTRGFVDPTFSLGHLITCIALLFDPSLRSEYRSLHSFIRHPSV